MSFVYTPAKVLLAKGLLNLHTGGDDIRLALLKVAASTTADTEQDTALMNAFTTLGEIVATNYARAALASEVVNEDAPNDRAEFDASDVTFTALGGAANDTIGAVLIYKHVTDDTDSIPIAYIDNAGSSFAQATNGSDLVVQFNAEGIIQLT